MLLHSIEELSAVRGPIHLAIGVFDGVHLGHQAVIAQAVREAKASGGSPVVVTFDPHPVRVLRPEAAPRLLTSTQHKVRVLSGLGVEFILLIHFDATFAATPPEQFIRSLAAAAQRLKSISVGRQWAFGKERAGNLELLTELGKELGFSVVGVDEIEIEGVDLSSTLIRAAIREGRLDEAARSLGRDFTIFGTVEPGDGLGRQIGFPTANLATHNEQFPPNGVYAVNAQLRDRILPGVVNVGVRPTVHASGSERKLELHLFDIHEDLYGQDIEVSFVKFLRPEQKFGGIEELKAQIARDVETARAVLAK